MASCHDMKKGEIYICRECGLELMAVNECRDSGKASTSCSCHDDTHEECSISCCGQDMEKK
jgi:hypothetical protein